MQTRRQFVHRAGAAGAGLILAPQTLALAGGGSSKLLKGSFDQGVLSGDPTPSSIVLWTHLKGEGSGNVQVEVATDKGFGHVVAHSNVKTSDALGHAVKARVKGLKAGERYYYRFVSGSKDSPVGRFETARPADSRETVRFAMISCVEYTFGYYNALALLANENVDFVINTGDYIYGDVSWPKGLGVRPTTKAPQDAHSVDDYRAKYAVTRSDKNLQKVHANFAFIDLWDDHEVQNNYVGADAAGGSEVNKNTFSQQRKLNAWKTWFEVMPTYSFGGQRRIYHKASFGKAMDLFVLDERQYRDSQPCGNGPFPSCPEAAGDVDFLGAAQDAFFIQGLKSSKASWKVVANELQISGRRNEKGELDDTDSWQGYLRDREAVLAAAKEAGDVVFVTGDVHEFRTAEVQNAQGQVVAAEFAGGSITAASDVELQSVIGKPGFGTPDNPTEPPDVHAARLANNPEWKAIDGRHGYLLCEVTTKQFKATWKTVPTIRRQTTSKGPSRTFTVKRGSPQVSG